MLLLLRKPCNTRFGLPKCVFVFSFPSKHRQNHQHIME